jgi:hypothetical protein
MPLLIVLRHISLACKYRVPFYPGPRTSLRVWYLDLILRLSRQALARIRPRVCAMQVWSTGVPIHPVKARTFNFTVVCAFLICICLLPSCFAVLRVLDSVGVIDACRASASAKFASLHDACPASSFYTWAGTLPQQQWRMTRNAI